MIYIASDHVGKELKQYLIKYLTEIGYQCEDLGPYNNKRANYTTYANKLASKIKLSDNKGILICGTGIGMSIMANRHRGIIAAVCINEYMARLTVMHNNANVICLGSRILGEEIAKSIVNEFLNAHFEGGRHLKRVKQYDSYTI
jgi:ribose 5-phosphate isomerase B